MYSTRKSPFLPCPVLIQVSIRLDESLVPTSSHPTQYLLNIRPLRWFLFGSIFITAASAIVLANSYNEVIGTDDSFLSRPAFRASWALLVVSGAFCTVGSVSRSSAVQPCVVVLLLCPALLCRSNGISAVQLVNITGTSYRVEVG